MPPSLLPGEGRRGLVAPPVALADYNSVLSLANLQCLFLTAGAAGVPVAWNVAGWDVAVGVKLGVHVFSLVVGVSLSYIFNLT